MTLILAIVVIFCYGSGGLAEPVDTIAKSCNIMRAAVDFDFCVSQLRSVPGSESTDPRGLVLMTIDLAVVSGSIAWDTAMKMARVESDPVTRHALEACGHLYWATSIPALRQFRKYMEEDNWGPTISLWWLLDAGTGCDAALQGRGATASKMAGLNSEFNQLATMVDMMVDGL